MLKEIAVYVNGLGKVADLNEAGTIKIFLKDNDKWKVIRELAFKFHSIERKEDIRLDTINIAESLGNCKIFVARELTDLIFTMFDNMGFSIWKMEGKPNEILEYVLEKEEEEAEEIKLIDDSLQSTKKQAIGPAEIGSNGYYIFNLKELQEHNTGITSKQALRPFLYNVNFNELIVTCSHIPHWLEHELKELNLNFEFSKTGLDDYIVIINKK